jgi:hypothetical protein
VTSSHEKYAPPFWHCPPFEHLCVLKSNAKFRLLAGAMLNTLIYSIKMWNAAFKRGTKI